MNYFKWCREDYLGNLRSSQAEIDRGSIQLEPVY